MKDIILTMDRYETLLKKEMAFEILREYHQNRYYLDEQLTNTLFGKPKKLDDKEDF